MTSHSIFVFIAIIWLAITIGVAWDASKNNRNPFTWGFVVGVFGIFGLMAYAWSYSGGSTSSNSDTVLRVSADVRDEETEEETRMSLKVHTDSVDQATKQFKQRCHSEGYLLQEKPTVDVE